MKISRAYNKSKECDRDLVRKKSNPFGNKKPKKLPKISHNRLMTIK